MPFITPDTDRYRQIQVQLRADFDDRQSNPILHHCQYKKTRKPDDHDIFHLAYNPIAGLFIIPDNNYSGGYILEYRLLCVSLTAG